MGKVNAEPANQTSINHFSHSHPLQLSSFQVSGTNSCCAACKLQASGPVYICTPCNFVLHTKCFELPAQIKHGFHQNHILYLQPKPVYPEGFFNCDACGNQGNGFSYHCSPCGIDLHSACASLPMQFNHHSHQHALALNFSSPYPGNSFSCDICRRVSSNTWLYRCSTCEFDVHLTCVQSIIPNVSSSQNQVIRPTMPNVSSSQNQVIRPMIATRSIPQPAVNPNYQPNWGPYVPPPTRPPQVAYPAPTPMLPTQPQFGTNPYTARGIPQMPVYNNYNQHAGYAPPPTNNNGLGDQIMVGAVNGVASGASQAATQALIQDMFGGGGGGGGGGGSGGDVSQGSGGEMQMMDESSYYEYDCSYGGTDGSYDGGDGTYNG